MFENRMLMRIFGPKKKEVLRGWTRLHNEKLLNLYTSPIITWVIKSRRKIWTWHVEHIGEI
jgi:hypothetical protein